VVGSTCATEIHQREKCDLEGVEHSTHPKSLCPILLFGYHLISLHCLIHLHFGKCCICLPFLSLVKSLKSFLETMKIFDLKDLTFK
jgi:hypothetical protein